MNYDLGYDDPLTRSLLESYNGERFPFLRCLLGEPKCKMVGIDVHSVDKIKAMGVKAVYA